MRVTATLLTVLPLVAAKVPIIIHGQSTEQSTHNQPHIGDKPLSVHPRGGVIGTKGIDRIAIDRDGLPITNMIQPRGQFDEGFIGLSADEEKGHKNMHPKGLQPLTAPNPKWFCVAVRTPIEDMPEKERKQGKEGYHLECDTSNTPMPGWVLDQAETCGQECTDRDCAAFTFDGKKGTHCEMQNEWVEGVPPREAYKKVKADEKLHGKTFKSAHTQTKPPYRRDLASSQSDQQQLAQDASMPVKHDGGARQHGRPLAGGHGAEQHGRPLSAGQGPQQHGRPLAFGHGPVVPAGQNSFQHVPHFRRDTGQLMHASPALDPLTNHNIALGPVVLDPEHHKHPARDVEQHVGHQTGPLNEELKDLPFQMVPGSSMPLEARSPLPGQTHEDDRDAIELTKDVQDILNSDASKDDKYKMGVELFRHWKVISMTTSAVPVPSDGFVTIAVPDSPLMTRA